MKITKRNKMFFILGIPALAITSALFILWLATIFFSSYVRAAETSPEELEWVFKGEVTSRGQDYIVAYITGIGGKEGNAFALSAKRQFEHVNGHYLIAFGVTLELPPGVRVSPLSPLVKIDNKPVDLVVDGVERALFDSGYVWQFPTTSKIDGTLYTLLANAKEFEMRCMLYPKGEAIFKLKLNNTDKVLARLIAYISKKE